MWRGMYTRHTVYTWHTWHTYGLQLQFWWGACGTFLLSQSSVCRSTCSTAGRPGGTCWETCAYGHAPFRQMYNGAIIHCVRAAHMIFMHSTYACPHMYTYLCPARDCWRRSCRHGACQGLHVPLYIGTTFTMLRACHKVPLHCIIDLHFVFVSHLPSFIPRFLHTYHSVLPHLRNPIPEHASTGGPGHAHRGEQGSPNREGQGWHTDGTRPQGKQDTARPQGGQRTARPQREQSTACPQRNRARHAHRGDRVCTQREHAHRGEQVTPTELTSACSFSLSFCLICFCRICTSCHGTV